MQGRFMQGFGAGKGYTDTRRHIVAGRVGVSVSDGCFEAKGGLHPQSTVGYCNWFFMTLMSVSSCFYTLLTMLLENWKSREGASVR
jgi:hypothetical protein